MVNEEEYEKAQFIQLVFGLQSSAWMLMGKVMNPLSGKIEKNLPQAKATIDTLQMLKSKTKGNLSEEEEEILTNSLQQLQLNYIQEAQAPAEEIKSDEKEPGEKKEAKPEKKKNNDNKKEEKEPGKKKKDREKKDK